MSQSNVLFHPAATMQGGSKTSAIAADIVSWLLAQGQATSRSEAVAICSRLHDAGLLLSCIGAPQFVDAFSSCYIPPTRLMSVSSSKRCQPSINVVVEFVALSEIIVVAGSLRSSSRTPKLLLHRHSRQLPEVKSDHCRCPSHWPDFLLSISNRPF